MIQMTKGQDSLKRMGKWLQFLSVVGFIVGIATISFGLFVSCIHFFVDFDDYPMLTGEGHVAFGLTHSLLGVLWLYPSRKMFVIRKGIQQSNGSETLESAPFINELSTLFQYFGILLAIGLLSVFVLILSLFF